MYHKVLIANRGEIAVRVIRACRELGVRTVAVYSDVDHDALHVRMADEAECIGPAAPRDSYCNTAAILEAAARHHVDAIHPGYGFLAENANFAAVCKTWGLDFIGPEPETIERMGSKAGARQRMSQAGVPIVPGTSGPCSEDECRSAAARIGYPVLLKAAAGGGGLGIRAVQNPDELAMAFAASRREAQANFAEADLYLEKYLPQPRHIEFQILADRHGKVLHLFERESSMQRRRQKILEEAPGPHMTETLRRAMAEAAVEAARAVHYIGAGTVEFLVDREGNFYFIEMNTRIQVEHTVTEMTTGIDLVKAQIEIAAGIPLQIEQDAIERTGCAIEMRINAEDPQARFAPCPGTISEWSPPAGPWVRTDDGVYTGYTVQPYYDSLLCKLVVWGRDRTEAIARARRALDEFRAAGIATTIELHRRIVREPEFVSGIYHTGWLEENLDRLIAPQ